MQKRRVTLRQLAKDTQISPSYLSLLLSGQRELPSPEIVTLIAKALGLAPHTLLLVAGYVPRNDRRFDRLVGLIRKMDDNELDRMIEDLERQSKARRRG